MYKNSWTIQKSFWNIVAFSDTETSDKRDFHLCRFYYLRFTRAATCRLITPSNFISYDIEVPDEILYSEKTFKHQKYKTHMFGSGLLKNLILLQWVKSNSFKKREKPNPCPINNIWLVLIGFPLTGFKRENINELN